MKIAVKCPKCGNVDKYDNHCDRCGGLLDWSSGHIKATYQGVECLDCKHIIWQTECQACGHTVPIIGKLAEFDDPALARGCNAFGKVLGFFLGPSRPA